MPQAKYVEWQERGWPFVCMTIEFLRYSCPSLVQITGRHVLVGSNNYWIVAYDKVNRGVLCFIL